LRLLLDSHALVWWLLEDPQLAPDVAEAIEDEANDVLASAVTVWEIEIKKTAGKLRLPGDVALQIQAAGFTPLPITYRHAHVAAQLPRHHGDPFDRMLVAQAMLEDASLVTADGVLDGYGVPILPAR
jgi:PIN domain nuclease of toxin-antitoxin system